MRPEKTIRSSPQNILLGVFILSAMPFVMVELFRAQLYHVMNSDSYLVFHNIVEFFSAIVSFSIFGVGWFTYDQSQDRHALFLSSAFLAVGLMDFMHILGYAGMPAFITPNSANKSTQFWIAVRFFTASALLVSAFVYADKPNRCMSKTNLMMTALGASAIVFSGITFFPSYLPATFIEGIGLTPFKKLAEALIIFLLLLASAAYWKRMSKTGDQMFLYYLAAFVLYILSELVFAVYKSVFDTYNVLGHVYKIVAFSLIYRGIFIVSIRRPHMKLREEISERKRVEAELEEHRAHLEELVENRTKELEIREKEAESANKTKSDFLANMSHELRTPLNSIIGFSEVLEDNLYGKLNEKQGEYVKNIYSSGKYLLSLINDILDLAKVESGKMELELSRFLIKDGLNAPSMMLKGKAMKHGISLSCDIEPDADIEIEADERKLRQIMYNLLSNAVKFTKDGGSVRVSARKVHGSQLIAHGKKEVSDEQSAMNYERSTDLIEISIADTGIGIKKEDIPKLFREFTHLESAYTKEYDGTGLGLALTKKLVELHGGKIWVESEFGKGSKFTFVIPVSQYKGICIGDMVNK